LLFKQGSALRNIYDSQLAVLAMVSLGTSVVIAIAVGHLGSLVRPHH
jgi:hypothetical protein